MLDSLSTGLMNGLARSPESLMYAKQQSMKYLAKMPEGTQVAILQLGSTLKVLQDFTSDKAVLLAAVNSAKDEAVGGAYIMSPPNSVMEECNASNRQSELTVNALAQAAAFLSGVRGRKNLIWFTPGTPWLTEYPVFSGVPCLNDYTPQLHRAYAFLNAARVAVYPIDPRGLFTDPAGSAASNAGFGSHAASTRETTFGIGAVKDHEALQDIAEATGGVPYFNRNDLDAAIGEAIQTGEDYYSLAYVPPLSKYDGKFHTISVKVDRPKLHLQYRAGYTSVDPDRPAGTAANSSSNLAAQSGLLTQMAHGQAASTQLIFDVRVTPAATPAKPGDPEVIGVLNPAMKHPIWSVTTSLIRCQRVRLRWPLSRMGRARPPLSSS